MTKSRAWQESRGADGGGDDGGSDKDEDEDEDDDSGDGAEPGPTSTAARRDEALRGTAMAAVVRPSKQARPAPCGSPLAPVVALYSCLYLAPMQRG